MEWKEEKLSVSKALVELKIENKMLQDRLEGEKYELASKLLVAENDLLEIEMQGQVENLIIICRFLSKIHFIYLKK